MSEIECDLCQLLLEQHFGAIVGKVGSYLSKNGMKILPEIVKGTGLSVALVRKSLCVLIQHNVVECRLHRKKFVLYHLQIPKVVNWIFYPKVLITVMALYGEVGTKIAEEILKNGMMRMTVCIDAVTQIFQTTCTDMQIPAENIKKVFVELVKTHFIIRKPMVKIPDDDSVQILPEYLPNDLTMFQIPEIKTEVSDQPQYKRIKLEDGALNDYAPVNDDGIYWIVNIPRFHRYFRDQLIISAIGHKFGINYGEITRAILRISEVTTDPCAEITQPLSCNEIHRGVQDNLPELSVADINNSLKLLNADSEGIVAYSVDGNENLFCVDFQKSISQLVIANIISYIQEKFGKKGCRIFRLLLIKKHLEQKQIEDIAMIPSKEAKEILYGMLAENLLTLQEIPKTLDRAPSRTYFLFAVNIPKVVRNLLQMTYKGMFNLISRWNWETEMNKRLIEKREKIDTIKANMQDGNEEQIQEIEEMMTETEKLQLSKSIASRRKLDLSQTQLSDTILLFNFYLSIAINKPTIQSS